LNRGKSAATTALLINQSYSRYLQDGGLAQNGHRAFAELELFDVSAMIYA
jgi:hypothetical protein